MSRRLSWISVVAVCWGLGASAHADGEQRRATMLDGNAFQEAHGIELGALVESGHSQYADNASGLSPDVQGLLIRDRNGVTARMVIGLIVAIGGAMAASGPKSVESHSYVSGDYLVTETTTTYYSEAEKAEMRENTSHAIDGLFSAKYSDFELHLFSRDRFNHGNAGGYKINMYVGGGDKIAFEGGLGFGQVDSLVNNGGMPARVTWKYLGMPFRVSTVKGPLRFALSYEWNWVKYGVTQQDRVLHPAGDGVMEVRSVSNPWHLDASTLLLKRIALTGGITTQMLTKPQLGYYLQAGVFF